jgi:hypothetical protein
LSVLSEQVQQLLVLLQLPQADFSEAGYTTLFFTKPHAMSELQRRPVSFGGLQFRQ